jgi:hypothetical protein
VIIVNSKIIRWLVLCIVLGLMLLSASEASFAQTQVEPALPETIRPCLPQSVERIEQLGLVQQEQEAFYLLGAFQNDRYWELLVQTDAAGCLLVKGQQDTEPLSAYIPLETAQQLVLQRYQRRIEESGGLQAFQHGFTEYMTAQPSGEISYLAPENVWALQQLGVEIPEGTYQIRRPNTPPSFEPSPNSRSRRSQ